MLRCVPERHQSARYVIGLIPEDAMPEELVGSPDILGESIRLVGRYIGLQAIHNQRYPVIIARQAVMPQAEAATSVEHLLQLGSIGQDEAVSLTWDPTAFDEIDDIRPLLEWRPYAMTVGRVARDTARGEGYDEAQPIGQSVIALHRQPSAFRGQPFIIEGMVADVWEDQFIARERPFGVDRVLRIRMTNREYGERPVRDLAGNEIIEHSSWLEGYELAAIVDAETAWPQRGERISARGRFVKVLGYDADIDAQRDAEVGLRRDSDYAYFKLFVTDGFTVQPRRTLPDGTVLKWMFVGITSALLLLLVRSMYRTDAEADRLRPVMRRMRQKRRDLQRHSQSDEPQTADSVSEEPADAHQPASTATGDTTAGQPVAEAGDKPR